MDEVAQIAKVQFLHGNRGRISCGHKREGQCALPGEVSGRAIKLAHSKGCDDAIREVSRSHSSRAIDEGPNRLRNASGSFQNLIGQLRRKTATAEGARPHLAWYARAAIVSRESDRKQDSTEPPDT